MGVVEGVFNAAVLERKAYWDEFRKRHAKAFAFLYNILYRPYKFQRRLHYGRIYRTFRDFTMISKHGFAGNLNLCDRFRHVEGSVVECGTWRGGMIAGIACLFHDSRHYCLYDSYEGLPPASEFDIDRWGQSAGDLQQKKDKSLSNNNAADISYAQKAMSMVGVRNVHICKGWFKDTLPKYDFGPIAILRADGDFYESTIDTLENLFDYVAEGGLILFDDYYYWDGCAKALHEFLSKHGLSEKICQSPEGYAYIVKRQKLH